MKKITILLCTSLMAFVGFSTKAVAQDFDTLHTNTWGIYLQGGISWAGGVEMQNVNATTGTNVSPLIGLGVNYNIRPWVRLGLNYEFSKFAREQRFGEFQPLGPQLDPDMDLKELYGGTAYRKMWSHYHNVDLTVEFNVMEIWRNRKAKWFNLYLGTGVGGMFAKGNSYELAMGHERWSDPDNYLGDLQIGNSHEMYTWMTANNNRHRFNALYIPVVLSAEFDVMPKLTLGVKGSGKFLCTSKNMAPKNVWAAALTIRYNFIGAKHGYKSNKTKLRETQAEYESMMALYSKDQDDCRKSQAAAQTDSDAQRARVKELEATNAQLAKDLEEARKQPQMEAPRMEDMSVQFRMNSDRLSAKQKNRLMEYIETAKRNDQVMFDVVAEASAEGNSTYNQELSERRLAHVLDLLNRNGISKDRIKTATAIGDSAQINDAVARRVTVKIEE